MPEPLAWSRDGSGGHKATDADGRLMAVICKVTSRSRLRAFVYNELATAFTYTLRPMTLKDGKIMIDRKWAEIHS